MKTLRLALLTLVLLACSPPPPQAQAQAPQHSLFAAAPSQQWPLPEQLYEVSGLAVSPDGRLFGHDDEHAVIYEIDARRGRLVKAFALGDAPITGDFEGLAITPAGDFWLTTSAGVLYRFREGDAEARVAWESFDTELANVCEVEGLAYLAAEESLILACKRNKTSDMRGDIVLRSWRVGEAQASPWLRASEAEVAAAAGVSEFHPSAVEIDPRSGRVLVLAAADRAFAEFSPDGALVSARSLRREHRQAEGLAVLADGTLVIVDEGGRRDALLSLYGRADP